MRDAELQEIGLQQGLALQRTIDVYLDVVALGDIIRAHAPQGEGAMSGRMEWDLARKLGQLTGFSPNKIRAHATLIRMHEAQELTAAEQRSRHAQG